MLIFYSVYTNIYSDHNAGRQTSGNLKPADLSHTANVYAGTELNKGKIN